MRAAPSFELYRARAAFGPLAFAFALALTPGAARAQEPLTRADSAAVLVGTAERMDAEGADALAEAIARMVERRYADTPAAARATQLLATLRTTRRDRSGRVELIAWSTLYGAWLGVAVPAMLDADGPEAYGLGLIVGAPAGLLAGRAYSRDRSVSAGDARAITFGGSWGTWQGAGWQLVLEIGEGACSPTDVDCSADGTQELFGMMVGGGLVGLAAGAIAANNTDIGAGTATLVNFGALWGTWYGVVAAVLADLDDEDDGVLTAALLGGDAGLVAMALVAPRVDMSRNRARLINAAGIIGLAVGGGMDLLTTPDDEKVAIGIPALTSALGLYIGTYLTRDYDGAPRMREGRLDTGAESSFALLGLRDGRWRVSLPQPTPRLLRSGPAARESGVAVHVPLLDARF